MGTAQAAAFFWRTRLRTCSLIGRIVPILVTSLACAALASAADVPGNVTNGTTKKPSPGDEVVLLALSNGSISETARAQTDSLGRFRFTGVGLGPFSVRVIHQGVTYDESVKANGLPVDVSVYDAVSILDGVTAVMDVQRFEATSDTLEVKQLVTMRNNAKPPRTLTGDHPFEFQLPSEAQVRSGLVQIEDGKPLRVMPTPGAHKGEYYFRYPLRPGDTRFAVVYRLSYNGQALIEPDLRNTRERFVVMLPKSMKFEPQASGIFRLMPDVSPDNVQGTASVTPGQMLAFRISGTGVLTELQATQQQALSGEPPLVSGALTRPPKPRRPPGMPPRSSQNNDSFILLGITVALMAGTVAFYWKNRAAVAVPREPNSIHSQQSRRPTRQGPRFRSG